MENLIAWITEHAQHAHWYIFAAILLAGFNIPISADVMVVTAAVLAAAIIPEHAWHLYLAIFLGCYFSAMIAYWVGRLLGKKLGHFGWFQRFFPPQRMEKIQNFYHKHGLWTLIIGRFIPFGVRNCIFMSSGMSRIPFFQFILQDFVACLIWTATTFYLFFTVGKNIPTLMNHLKIVNIIIFLAFGVTVITLLWYKRKKKTAMENL
ncbi:MAG: DedA family protein [Rhabdochlamydiaceae bacterium]|jgi:membrane protein DedA with SNARE-associated domain